MLVLFNYINFYRYSRVIIAKIKKFIKLKELYLIENPNNIIKHRDIQFLLIIKFIN